MARQFGIEALLGRQARKLSGGEAQRTSLARAFALEPEILFLDEPFSKLDPPTREALLADLGAALRQTATTAVLATHDRMEALQLADRLAVMHQGRIKQIGTGTEVVNQPVDEFVAEFVGMETLLPGHPCGIRQQRPQQLSRHGHPDRAPGALFQGRAGLRLLDFRLRHPALP